MAALRQLQNDSVKKSLLVLELLEKKEMMVLMVKCLQFSDNEIKRSVVVSLVCHL